MPYNIIKLIYNWKT